MNQQQWATQESEKKKDIFEMQLWQFEKKKQEETIAKKKEEVANLRKQAEQLDKAHKRKKIELMTIDELLNQQTLEGGDIMERTLKKVGTLEQTIAKGFDKEKQTKALEIYLQPQTAESKVQKVKMFQELLDIRTKDERLKSNNRLQ